MGSVASAGTSVPANELAELAPPEHSRYDRGVDWQQTCAVVIPCLDEEAAIAGVVRAVRKLLPHVIVVDDGSTDGTAAAAESAGAIVLRHSMASGKGAALRTGWNNAVQHGFSWGLCMDGDGQHAPEDIPKFLTRAADGDVALVVGERMHAPGSMPWVRRCTNHFMSWQLSRLAGTRLTDTQCGFRLMRLQAWVSLPIQSHGFEIESEVLLHFARARQGIAFVPIRVIYGGEQSKIRPLRDTVRWWRWLRGAAKARTECRNT